MLELQKKLDQARAQVKKIKSDKIMFTLWFILDQFTTRNRLQQRATATAFRSVKNPVTFETRIIAEIQIFVPIRISKGLI